MPGPRRPRLGIEVRVWPIRVLHMNWAVRARRARDRSLDVARRRDLRREADAPELDVVPSLRVAPRLPAAHEDYG